MFIVHCLFNSVGFRSPLFRKNRAMRPPVTNSLVLHFYRLCLTVNTLLPATYPYCSTPYITLTSILRKLRDAGCCSPASEQRSRRHRLIRFLTCISSRLCRRKAILAARWRHRLNVIGALIQRSEAKTREVGDVSGGDEQKGMIYYLRGCCYQGYDGCRCCCCLRLRLIVGCYYRPIQTDISSESRSSFATRLRPLSNVKGGRSVSKGPCSMRVDTMESWKTFLQESVGRRTDVLRSGLERVCYGKYYYVYTNELK